MKERNEKDEKIEKWKSFWPSINQAALDSEDHFDKKVYAVSAGALGFELTLLQFIKQPELKVFAWIAAFLCILCLMINLCVQIFGKRKQDKQMDTISEYFTSDKIDDQYIHDQIRKDNQSIFIWNIVSLFCLILGILSLAVFAILNIK